jgi:hypothetical protein
MACTFDFDSDEDLNDLESILRADAGLRMQKLYHVSGDGIERLNSHDLAHFIWIALQQMAEERRVLLLRRLRAEQERLEGERR